MPDSNQRKVRFAAWAGMIAAILLTLLKGVVGFVCHSKALVADAAHSASVLAGSVAVLMGAQTDKSSRKVNKHNGAGKTETITAIIVSVVLMVVGIEIAASAVRTIMHGVTGPPQGFTVVAIVFSLLVKEAIFRYKYALGKRIASQSLLASAWEHRTDMYPSFVALVGVTGALLGQLLEMEVLFIFDPVASFFIALLLFKLGYRMVLDTVHPNVEHVMRAEDAAELIGTVQKIKGIITVDELRARERGSYILIDVIISVNPKISVHEGHDIARLVKQQLMKRFLHISDVLIQVNPYDPGYPYKNNVDPDQDERSTLLH